ncbi:glycosyltransferase family 9 protein [Chroococcidiopsidales cyanobacterium LEGE 13417]|nr:glycosyltransferase family 9 protein [Chroococcidiopsidales cyanobacterium LEGE 13417]
MSYSHRLPKVSQVAIARCLPGLGDLLCIVPALRALRAALPEARMTLIGLPNAQSFVKRFNCYIDAWLEFPGYPGIPEGWRSPQHTQAFLTQVQAQAFDLVIQMHGSGIVSNSFVVLLGAKLNAGFFLPGYYCPDPEWFLPYPDREAEVRRHLRLMAFLDIPLQGEQLEFPLWESDWWELQQISAVHDLQSQHYICIHPGASISDRRWSPRQFALVADALAQQGFAIVLTGTAAETGLTEAVAEAMNTPAINLAGRTSLGALGALLKQAALLVCNDTGVSHLASALQVKSVVIFSNSDPDRWRPLDRDRHRIVFASNEGAIASVLTQAKDLLQQEASKSKVKS